jgi:hypothetical protein
VRRINPHAKQLTYEPQQALRSADEEREALPVGGDAERSLPDVRCDRSMRSTALFAKASVRIQSENYALEGRSFRRRCRLPTACTKIESGRSKKSSLSRNS